MSHQSTSGDTVVGWLLGATCIIWPLLAVAYFLPLSLQGQAVAWDTLLGGAADLVLLGLLLYLFRGQSRRLRRGLCFSFLTGTAFWVIIDVLYYHFRRYL